MISPLPDHQDRQRILAAGNRWERPLGPRVAERSAGWPPLETIPGRYCRLERLCSRRHGGQLFASASLDTQGQNWVYSRFGPFEDFASYQGWLEDFCQGSDPLFYALIDGKTDQAMGMASFLDTHQAERVTEIGYLNFSPALQRTTVATEALFLMLDTVFTLGFRRCAWRCDALNFASRRAAQRLGFVFEGIFRNALVVKGRSRDTAWYSIIDREWPLVRKEIESWLQADNFDHEGCQRTSLACAMKERCAQAAELESPTLGG